MIPDEDLRLGLQLRNGISVDQLIGLFGCIEQQDGLGLRDRDRSHGWSVDSVNGNAWVVDR